MTTVFDAAKYKATTREQWQSAADAWNAWGPSLRSWLGPATELMLDMTRTGDGASVLDVAAAPAIKRCRRQNGLVHAGECLPPISRRICWPIAPTALVLAE